MLDLIAAFHSWLALLGLCQNQFPLKPSGDKRKTHWGRHYGAGGRPSHLVWGGPLCVPAKRIYDLRECAKHAKTLLSGTRRKTHTLVEDWTNREKNKTTTSKQTDDTNREIYGCESWFGAC